MIVLLTTADTEVLATLRAAEQADVPPVLARNRVALPGFDHKVGAPLRPHHHPDDVDTHAHGHPAGGHAARASEERGL